MKFPILIALSVVCAAASASDFDSQASMTITATSILNTFGYSWLPSTPNKFGNVIGSGTHKETGTGVLGVLTSEGKGTATTDPDKDSISLSNATISEILRMENTTNHVIPVQVNYTYSWSVTGHTGAGETSQGEYEIAYGSTKISTKEFPIGENDSLNKSDHGGGTLFFNLNPGNTDVTFSETASGGCTSPMATPEPASFLMFGVPLVFLGVRRSRQQTS